MLTLYARVSGGGLGTLQTLAGCRNQPVIVVKGSERAADLIYDWCQFDIKIKAAETDSKVEALRAEQRLLALEQLRKLVPAQEIPHVGKFLPLLEDISENKELDFLTLNAGRQGATSSEEGGVPIIDTILQKTLQSENVKGRTKLFICIRSNQFNWLSSLFDDRGLKIRSTSESWVQDGRLIVYAAYHDQGALIDTMLSCGFPESALDSLILLEVEREIRTHGLKVLDDPPDWFVTEALREIHENDGPHGSLIRSDLCSEAERELISNEWKLLVSPTSFAVPLFH